MGMIVEKKESERAIEGEGENIEQERERGR